MTYSVQPDQLAALVHQAVSPLVAATQAHVDQLRQTVAQRDADVVDLRQQVAQLRERQAVIETRAPVPGPAGRDGLDGANGRDGRDGKDGISLTYRGVWKAGDAYTKGDVVTHHGSAWYCYGATSTAPDTDAGATDWQLMVKRGDKGRDLRETVPQVRAIR
jgi:hypothetical protein